MTSACESPFVPRWISTNNVALTITFSFPFSDLSVRIRPVVALLIGLAGVASAQQSIQGYSAASAQRERDIEASAIRRPSPESASAHSKQLSRETHVAGTPAQARTRDYVIEQMKKWGIETQVRGYDVWMPHPVSVHVSRVSPQPKELALAEPPVAGDPTSSLAQYLTVNGYSGEGDVTADIVYVNYGLIEDYAQLDSIGVSVKGKIAVARYGRSFRGIKAREAEKHGAVGLLIYSDPQDDGFVAGDVYPEGPMRNSAGVRRAIVRRQNGDSAHPRCADQLRERQRTSQDGPRRVRTSWLAGWIGVSISRWARAGEGAGRGQG